jgi:hypothetical protein
VRAKITERILREAKLDRQVKDALPAPSQRTVIGGKATPARITSTSRST